MILRSFLILLCFSIATLYATEVKLNSPRANKAIVLENKANNSLTVEFCFTPVTSLDDVSNNEMSITVSKFLTIDAISKFYQKDKMIIFKNSTIAKIVKEDDKTRIIWKVPFSDIQDSKKPQSRHQIKLQKMVLNNKNIFRNFRSSCFSELQLAETYWLEAIESNKKTPALKEKIVNAITKLKEKIDDEDTLFTSEKEELKERVENLKHFLLNKLSAEPDESKEKKKSAENLISEGYFDPVYQNLLKSDLLLLSIGGVRVIQLENGKKYIISVGKVTFTRSQLNTENLAKAAAREELNKHRAVKVTYFSESKENISTTYKNSQEDSTLSVEMKSFSSMEAASILRRLSTIGAWYSKDRKYFFIALGAFLEEVGI